MNLTSTWKSILSLQPEISSLKLIEPELSFKKEELTKNKIILVNNNFNPFLKFKNITKNFKKIIVENGIFNFTDKNIFHQFLNIEGSLNIDNNYELKFISYYSNIKANLNLKFSETLVMVLDIKLIKVFFK